MGSVTIKSLPTTVLTWASSSGGKGLTAVSTATWVRFPATADLTFEPQRHRLVSWAWEAVGETVFNQKKLKTQTSISKLTLVLHLTRSMNLTRPTKLIFYLCTSMFATNNGLKNTRYIVLILSPPTRQTTSDKMCTVWLRMDPSVLSVTKNIYIFTFFFCQLKCINISKP